MSIFRFVYNNYLVLNYRITWPIPTGQYIRIFFWTGRLYTGL